MGQNVSSASNSSSTSRPGSGQPHQTNRTRHIIATEQRRSRAGVSSGYKQKTNRSNNAAPNSRAIWPHHTLQPLESPLQLANNQPSMSEFRFHHIHGKNIVLSTDNKTASRMGSFCNALVFTHRAIHIGEIFHFELIQNTAGWSGVVRFGYTTHDPLSMRTNGIPKYACPDLAAAPGNWAKAVRESCAKHGNVLNFILSEDGTVLISVNQEPFVEFVSGVDTNRPVWGVIDVYGNTTGVRIVDTFPTSNRISTRSASVSSNFQDSLKLVSDLLPNHGQVSAANQSSNTRSQTPKPEPLPFHSVHGFNIVIDEQNFVADRKATCVSGGIVFSSRPVKCDEKVLVEVIAVNHCYIGHMGVGLTSCDPGSLSHEILPLEAEDICDRKEYWVMTRDFDNIQEGDSLGFTLASDGRFHVTGPDVANHEVLMHVDTTSPLWLFFDLYGTTQTIKILGVLKNILPPLPAPALENETSDIKLGVLDETNTATSITAEAIADSGAAPTPPPRLSSAAKVMSRTAELSSSTTPKTRRTPPPRPSKPPVRRDSECTVCFENAPDAVFYKCGHVCCCMACASKLKQRCDPCPLCRAPIDDIIKFFKM